MEGYDRCLDVCPREFGPHRRAVRKISLVFIRPIFVTISVTVLSRMQVAAKIIETQIARNYQTIQGDLECR